MFSTVTEYNKNYVININSLFEVILSIVFVVHL